MSSQAIADGVNIRNLYLDELKALKDAVYHAKLLNKMENIDDEFVWHQMKFNRAVQKADEAMAVLYDYDLNPYEKK